MGAVPDFGAVVTWTAPDPVTEGDYQAILALLASNYGDTWATSSFEGQSVLWSMKARHVLYWHGSQPSGSYVNGQVVSWGNCGTPKPFSAPEIDSVVKGLGLGASLEGITTTGAEIAGQLGVTAGTQIASKLAAFAAGPWGIAIAGISIAVGFVAALFNHHAEAVAKEQTYLCAAFGPANQLLDAIDAAVATGQLSAADAASRLEELATAFAQWTEPVTQNCNEGCILRFELRANIELRNNYLYPQLEKANQKGASASPRQQATKKTVLVAALAGLGVVGLGAL